MEAQRERKKAEDASRGEVRSKMKVLEESKRVADGVKRDVEKKLRAAESARDSASQRIGRLDKEIEALKEKMGDDETEMKKKEEEADEEEIQMKEQLEKKKKEIKVAEDVVAALSMRAKELEDKILAEEERLKTAKEQAELRKQDRDFFPLHVVTPDTTTPPIAPWNLPSQTGTQQDPHAFIHSDLSEPIEVFSQSLQQQQHLQHATRSRGGSYSSDSKDLSDPSLSSPRPRKLSLGVISNFHGQPGVIGSEVAAANSSSMVSGNGFSAYGDTIPVDHTLSTRFSPFDHNDVEVSVPVLSTSLGDTSTGDGSMYSGVDSPKSSSLIPTSLIESLAGEDHRPLHLHTQLPLPQQQQHLSRSFQSEDDDILERNWRKTCPFPAHPVESPTTAYTSSSPSSLTNPSFEGVDREDPFEVRAPRPPQATHLQRFIREPVRSSSDPQVLVVGGGTAGGYSQVEENRNEEKGVGHRRWLSSPKVPQPHSSQTQQQQQQQQMQMQLQFQEKKGLNPEAKAFQLPKTFGFPTMFHTLPKRHTTLEGNEMHSGHHLSQQQQQFVGAIGSSSAASLSSSSLNLVPSSVFPPSSSALQPGSLPHHPNHTTSNPTSDLPLAVNSNSSTNVSSHHRTLESLFSTISMRAFAPSPAEREALRRGLGSGSGNASLEMLPTLSEVEAIGGGRRSLPPSPSNVPALPNAPALSKMPTSVNVGVVGAIGEGSMRNGGVGGSIKQHQQQASSGLGWLASFPRMRKEKLSPWEDEVVRTSSSGKAVDRGQVGLNGIIGMPVNIRESWDKKRSDGNEGEGDRRMMG